MNTPTKLVGFALAAAAVFGLAVVVGRVVPVDDDVTATHDDSHTDDPPDGGHQDHESSSEPAAQTEIPGGLMVSQSGYTLALADDRAAPGRSAPVSFTIAGPDGAPVTEYDVEHEKELHLIAVRRDFSGFQHVHPTRDGDGVWSTDLDLTAGTWRIFADFKPAGGEALTLGTDLAVSGDHRPAAPAKETRTATVEGYEVTLDGDLTAGADAKLTLSVSKDGKPVTDLQPYLGAYGHLVALRGGDLAYLHVHPDGTPGDGTTKPGPDVVFYAAVPSDGTYHLYLDFQHEGEVRTAAFTVTADDAATTGGATAEPSDTSPGHDESGGHSGH